MMNFEQIANEIETYISYHNFDKVSIYGNLEEITAKFIKNGNVVEARSYSYHKDIRKEV